MFNAWDEPERLSALDDLDVLDTAAEQAFDDVARAAAHLCEAPMGAVSFVSKDRQWFKARIGPLPAETSRRASFCSHAIMTGDYFEVSNARLDPRFATNPLVLGHPYIRFYAGAVIRTEDGLPLGAVCIIDHHPRPWGLDHSQWLHLREAADEVILQLRKRRMLAVLENAPGCDGASVAA